MKLYFFVSIAIVENKYYFCFRINHQSMQKITIDIDNPKIENFLKDLSKSKNKTVNNLIYDIVIKYFEMADNQNSDFDNIIRKLVKQSETDYKENRISSHEDFEKETSLW